MPDLATATAGEQADALAGNVLGFFGVVKYTPEDQERLSKAIIHYAMHWTNDEFDIGLPCNARACPFSSLPSTSQ